METYNSIHFFFLLVGKCQTEFNVLNETTRPNHCHPSAASHVMNVQPFQIGLHLRARNNNNKLSVHEPDRYFNDL